MKEHPARHLNEIIHQRSRLGIMAILARSRRADFQWIRNELQLTDGNLSQHLSILEKAGFIEIVKGYEGKRPRTWVSATKIGRRAFRDEVRALRALLVMAAPETELEATD